MPAAPHPRRKPAPEADKDKARECMLENDTTRHYDSVSVGRPISGTAREMPGSKGGESTLQFLQLTREEGKKKKKEGGQNIYQRWEGE